MTDERVIRRLNIIIVLLLVPYLLGALYVFESAIVWVLVLAFGAVALLFVAAVTRGISLRS